MATFGEELRLYREKKNVSLQEIATATRINIRFLEAIERNDFHFLPEPYVRSMVREYAAYLELDPEKVMEAFDREGKAQQQAGVEPKQLPSQQPGGLRIVSLKKLQSQFTNIFSENLWQRIQTSPVSIAIMLLAAIGLVTFLLLRSAGTHSPVREIPFERVMKENEFRVSPNVRTAKTPSTQIPDSLELVGKTNDTVWIQIKADTSQPIDVILAPDRSYIWKAKQRFRITLGNAGGIQFTLNGKPIGYLGKRGVVIRDYEISRDRLRR
ncbi:MAG: helix-turn-helix domain-containing protein [Bacteroidota bacterium]